MALSIASRFVPAVIAGLILAFGSTVPAVATDETAGNAGDGSKTRVVQASDEPSDEGAERKDGDTGGSEGTAEEQDAGEPGDTLEGSEQVPAADWKKRLLEGIPTAPTDPRGDLEELTVTATKREESLQDVAISMSALNSEFLKESGITQFGQLAEYVPNLSINAVTDSRGTVMRIRGIGSPGNNAGIDPSVGLFIDGIYQGRAGMSVGDLLDIERVEVLRGPQGTLYGKNTAAGLINIISKRPSYEREGVVEAVYGNYNDIETRATLNIPIVDERIAARFSGYRVTRDGFDDRLTVAGREYDPISEKPILPDPMNDTRFTFVDGKVNDADKWGGKGRVLFDVTDDFSLLVTGDYSKEDTKCCVTDSISFKGVPTLSSFFQPAPPPGQWIPLLTFQNLAKYRVPGSAGRTYQGTGIPLPKDDGFDRLVGADLEPTNLTEIGGVSLDGSWDIPEVRLIGGSTLNFIGSWRTYSTESLFDGDFSYYDVARWGTVVDLNQYSAELRLASPGGELVDYQVGLYAYHQNMHTVDQLSFRWDAINLFLPGLFTPTINSGDNVHKTWSYAGFGQVTINPIEKLSITGGLRLTYEKKTRVGSQTCERWVRVGDTWDWVLNDPANPEHDPFDAPPVCGPPVTVGPGENERAGRNLSYMANVRYFATDEIMLYGSFATGFKSGGFNQLRVSVGTPSEFDDEKATNFEAGFRSTWLEGMLTVNATGFYTTYDAFQAQLFDGQSIGVRNAGSLVSYGFEGDLVLAPLEGLVIGSSVGFDIAEYAEFKNGEQTAQQRWDNSRGQLLTFCATAPVEACVQDLSGKTLDNLPRWTVSNYLQYEYETGWRHNLVLFTRAEYNFSSSRYLTQDLDPNLKQDATHLVNLRAGFRIQPESLWSNASLEVTGWVRNLLNEEWNVVGFDVPTINGFAGVNAPPRQFGVTARITF
jgi:iron complex outermembrane receptor protein